MLLMTYLSASLVATVVSCGFHVEIAADVFASMTSISRRRYRLGTPSCFPSRSPAQCFAADELVCSSALTLSR